MTKIKLIRSGGFLGKSLTSETETDIDEKEIMDALRVARAIPDMKSRDAFNYLISINNSENFLIDIKKIKNTEIKKIIEDKLLINLKA